MLSSMEKVMEDDNLLEEILLHLPAEIVHACKPVSKLWCSLISSLHFCKRHGNFLLQLPASSSKILMIDGGRASTFILLEVRNGVTDLNNSLVGDDKLLSAIRPSYEKLLQDESKEIDFGVDDVYNGLFLISVRIRDKGDVFRSVYDQGEFHYFVCNPLTKEYQQLPISSKGISDVAFAPSKPYKVIVGSFDHEKYVVQVYSSETHPWKGLGHLSPDTLYDYKSIVWDNCLLLVPPGKWHGLVLVIDSERLGLSYSSSLLPTSLRTFYSRVKYFGESGGFLYLVACIKPRSNFEKNRYKLWEMKGVGGSWVEKFEFRNQKDALILYVHRECEQKLWLVLWGFSTIYYCLNGDTESLREADSVEYPNWEWNVRSYTPTLLPLEG